MQAGVLATALIAGNVSCSNAAGGNEMGNSNGGGQTKVNHEFVADICGEEHKCQVAGCAEHGYTHPAYMNVTGDFGGQRFVESNADWFYDGQYDKNTKFTNHYNDANQYIDCKVAELDKLWQEKDTGSTLSNQIRDALSGFNNGTSISNKIDNNYTSLASVFNTMQNYFIDNNDVKNFHRFNVSYQKLAADAYKESLATYATNNSFPSIDELLNKSTNFFVKELSSDKADLSYQDATDHTKAEGRMNGYLSTIANKTDTNYTVLKKFIELALINESLYGLNDYAVAARANNSGLENTPRSLATFDNAIRYASVNYMQSIDDRTM